MRVGFDDRPAKDPRGIGRYARCLLDALRATAAPGDELLTRARPRGVDVFHSPWIDGARPVSRCPQIVTLHDLVPLKRRAEYLRTGIRFRLRYAATARAERVIVPTGAVAADAVALLGIAPERLSIIPEAAAPAMRPRGEDEVAAVRERYALPEDYLVWVGGLERPDPRKRVTQLVATPRELPLVLVGPTGPWAQRLSGVHLTGHVSDDELAAILTGAHALVSSSDDEGFGLPAVEALACGCPVVACTVPALEEVLGDGATFVDRDDLDGLLRAGAAATRPAPRPPDWSWEDAARATWRVYREVVARST